MRNPLTAALAAMALHALAGAFLGFPFPSAATFLAAGLAVGWATLGPKSPPRGLGGLAATAILAPEVVPGPLLLAAGIAFGVILLPVRPDPLVNVEVSAFSLTYLILLLMG